MRTLIYLFLLLKINPSKKQDYFILDSSSFDSIDRDDFDRLLCLLDIFGKQNNVQIICAGNKQNFNTDNSFYKAIVLTPEKTLFHQTLTAIKNKLG